MQSWADGEWFTIAGSGAESIKVAVFKVTGETNTDDLSPAPDAWSRPDIPLHALAMYKMTRDGLDPQEHGVTGPCSRLRNSRPRACRWRLSAMWSAPAPRANRPPTRCCGSSATTSTVYPTRRGGGICIGGKVAPIFYNTMEDAGALVFEAPVDSLGMGDVIEIRPYDGKILSESGEVLSEFELKSEVLLDEVRAGGRINLIIGRGLTTRAREALGLGEPTCSASPSNRRIPARASPWHRKW